jgi:hypothetical protein
LLQQAVDEGGLAVVDVGDDGDVTKVHGSSSGRAWWMRDLTGKPGPTFPDRASQNLEYWRVMTLLRIVIPRRLFCLSMISGQTRTAFVPRENRYHFSGSCSGGAFPQKGSPAKKTGQYLMRCGAIYSENAKKQWFVWHLVSRFWACRRP